jgi:uncharacterized short protein YbdD (DUF466 family)
VSSEASRTREAPLALTGVADQATAWRARLAGGARVARQGWLQIFGIPDYERYLAHAAAHHPDEPLLSRREFYLASIDRKYTGRGPRCC